MADGTYYENINFKGKAITVRSENGASTTIIDGGGSGSVVTFDSGESSTSVLDSFKLINGNASFGGGIFVTNSSSPSINNCTITNNTATWSGGGINCWNTSSPTITNTVISGNSASDGGGIACRISSSPSIINCTINNNSAVSGNGGGINCESSSSPMVDNCIINGNTATLDGGGIACYTSAAPTITGCTINNNQATGSGSDGGGIALDNSSPTISNCTITGNSTIDHGGGIYCNASSAPSITDCSISNNTATGSVAGSGGGIYSYVSSPTITNCAINNNSATGINYGFGGGICLQNSPSVLIDNCSITNNSSIDNGGGIVCYSSSPTITRSTISGNTSSDEGGGIACSSSSPTVTNSIISGNSAVWNGGGVYLENSSSPIITNCTIVANSVNSGVGGGIECENSSSPTVINSILWGNKAGGSPDEINLTDAGSSVTVDYSNINPSLILGLGTPSLSNNINSDPLFVDPRDASLAPTSEGDYHLQSGSPCIDAGDPASAPPDFPANDIDDDSRPLGSGYDIGSDEYCDSSLIWYRDADSDGYSDGTIIGPQCDDPGEDYSLAADLTATSGDCDDTNYSVNPAATEVCDGIDNDCDTQKDEDLTAPLNSLQDGVCAGSTQSCNGVGGWQNDYTGVSNYEATETSCDGLDNDCDAQVDDNLTVPLNSLQDGVCAGSVQTCNGVSGWQDNYSGVNNYEATETSCDNLDNDCDTQIDEDLTAPLNSLQDGVCAGSVQTCNGGVWEDDYSGVTNYEATETSCDSMDNDCDGQTDVGVKTTFYQDYDLDRYGNSAVTQDACSAPSGYVADNTDCNDTNAAIHPNATEVCADEIDNDCDGETDETPCGIYSEDFENGLGNWTAEGTWALITSDCHSSTTCMTDSPDENYPSYADSSLISPSIALPSTTPITLTFWHHYVFDDFYSYDNGLVEISTDGGFNWTTLATYENVKNTWKQELINVSSYSGQTVKFRFRLNSNGTRQYDGWYIDDVSVVKIQIGSLATPSSLSAILIPNNYIELNWIDNSTGEDGFKIERKEGSGGTWSEIATVGADETTYQDQDPGFIEGTNYCYRVRAYNSNENSLYSNEDCATYSRYIQTAIDEANDGDIILIGDGTYYENIDFKGKAITVRSINGAASTIIGGGGNDHVVTFSSNEESDSVLDGFSIQNGPASYGSGIYCSSSSPTITNCIISGNSAGDYGGGIYCIFSSSPTITNCTISGNSASDGGGIYCISSSPTITNCTITGNSASTDGGGIYCGFSSSPTITNCTISGNSASNGGGIYCYSSSSPTITTCTISGNSASNGGGIYCSTSSPMIYNCTVSNNSATDDGGGIFCLDSISLSIEKCIISGNSAGDDGGGIWSSNSPSLAIINCNITGNKAAGSPGVGHGGGVYILSSATIANSTLSGNWSKNEGGGIEAGAESIIVINSILWSNSPDEINDPYATVTATYSNIAGEYPGIGNINFDPLFVNPRPASEAPTMAGNYHLRSGSPCIDRGIDRGIGAGAPSNDIDGDNRPQGAGYDMGADESVGSKISLLSGTLNGQPLDPSNPEITVSAGNTISGSFCVNVFNSYASSAITPLAATTTWGEPISSYWQINGWVGTGNTTHTVSVNVTAPSATGTYYIAVAMSGVYNSAQIMSGTHPAWSADWINGNKVALLPASDFETGLSRAWIIFNWWQGIAYKQLCNKCSCLNCNKNCSTIKQLCFAILV